MKKSLVFIITSYVGILLTNIGDIKLELKQRRQNTVSACF